MATATVVTAERADEIEAASVTGATIEGKDLVLMTKGGTQINVGRIIPSLYEYYPVGSIYMTDRAANPASYMDGGTWVRWGKGRVPVSIDEAQPEFDGIEEEGGVKAHTLTSSEMPQHTHSTPAHSHTGAPHTHPGVPHTHSIDHDHVNASVSVQYAENTPGSGTATRVTDVGNVTGGQGTSKSATIDIPPHNGESGSSAAASGPATFTGNTGVANPANTGPHGGNAPHNNLQPYITVYMWKRIA